MKSTENTKNTSSRNHHRPSLGFTLVELIVVITILVILATIAFTQFGSFQGSARDGDRVTTLKNIEKGLDVFQVKSGIYPLPEGEVSQGTINGSTEVYAYKGEIGDYVSRLININKTPADPLSASHYAYALSGDKKTYQVATVMENTQAYNTLFSPITPAFAAQTSYQARVNGTYPGYIKFNSGAEVYIANIPSLIWSNSGETINLLSTGTYFVVNRQVNLPYKITPDTITENQTADILLQSITGQSNATLTGVNVTTVDTPEEIAQTFTGQTLASFAWVSGMEPNSSVSSHVVIMERVITGNSTTGGTYIPVYLNCSETTQSWYTIPPLAHATQTTQTKSIANGTGSLTADCTDGILSYNPETVSCTTPGFVEWPNLTCIADICGSTITDTNAHSTATSQTPAQSWHYDATPNICTYACNPNYTHNSGTNLCEPNNCTAGVQTYNTHTYSVPQLNHSVTGSVTSASITIPNGTQTFTLVYECSFWTATGITTEVANTPNCTTNFHYDTSTSSCVSDTQTHTCAAKPATGTAWNSVSSYSQTWNGASYIPADSTTAYNATTSTTSCRYKCDTGYVWNSGTSLCEVKLYVDDVFSAYTYTGNGGTQTINNGINLSGFGGMVWTKIRETNGGAEDHFLVDTISPHPTNPSYFVKALSSNSTQGYNEPYNLISAWTNNGYSVGNHLSSGGNGYKYISWTFRKAPKFFDVVQFSHTSGAITINHALWQLPGMVVIKDVNNIDNWWVYHRSTGNDYYLVLNQTAAKQSSPGIWGATASTFTIANGVLGNSSFVAYLFAHDTSADGIIQCGSVTGTYTANLGWEPQYLIQKRITGTPNEWQIYDVNRGWSTDSAGSSSIRVLDPSVPTAETGLGTAQWKINASGFSGAVGAETYIYCAIRRPNKPITDSTKVYNVIARTGNNITTEVAVGFSPDLVMSTDRTSGELVARRFVDRLRGNTQELQSNTTLAEGALSSSMLTLDTSNSVIFGAYNNPWYNKSTQNYINHFFRRAPGFFDQVAYTGNGVTRTVNHNLGVAPELWIIKARNSGVYHWQVGCTALTTSEFLNLNLSSAKDSYASVWNGTYPSSTMLSLGDTSDANINGVTQVAYLFATLPNISKVGSYSGSTSNVTVDCGFTVTPPRFLMVKRTDSTGDWFVWDSARGFDKRLSLNTVNAEVTGDTSITTTTSGFIANTSGVVNGGTSARYIYLCIH